MTDFQSGLFGCFNDCGLCLITYFLPCITFGQNAAALGKRNLLRFNIKMNQVKWTQHLATTAIRDLLL